MNIKAAIKTPTPVSATNVIQLGISDFGGKIVIQNITKAVPATIAGKIEINLLVDLLSFFNVNQLIDNA
jgi:hypothetical protein